MKFRLLIAASALALVHLSASAAAQHMPGMTMPMPEKPAAKKKPGAKTAPAKKKATPKKPTAKKAAAKKTTTKRVPGAHVDQAHRSTTSAPVEGMTMPKGQSGTPPSAQTQPPEHAQMPGMPMPAPGAAQAMPPMERMDHSKMGQMPMGEHAGHAMAMKGALGPYPMEREASGTAWQPDASIHTGLMRMSGDWTLMAHGVINFVADHQGGRRGGDKTFASGMLMGMARHPLGNGTVQFKAMVSPDPLMGKRGYPLLLASGETANGRDRLINRQHPHDFVMELSASASQNIGRNGSVFLYAGLPGEPAFGPPAFMHREAILDSPEAPISHHWLDSTHITFGVLTAGIVLDRAKVEVSRFNGREPDQHRWDIETAPLDSTSVRLSWNPTRTLALQASWAHLKDPEQLEPGINQRRLSASLLYAREMAPGWKLAATLAWGRKTVHGHKDDAWAAEASLKHRGWTLFGRGEIIENRELTENEDGPAYRVGKVSFGAVRDFRIADHLSLGAGGLFAVNFVPDALRRRYGSTNPAGAMAFLRLRLDGN